MKKVIKKYKSWNKIPWGLIQTDIFNLQYKIFKHAKRNEIGKVLLYQKKLVNSEHAKLLAVRMVTQDNRGKKTAGVDGLSELNPTQRFQLVTEMILNGKASPIKRVWIAKANGKLRPLGIPTMEDRAKQCLVKMALEPEWESRFEINSYGFRPGYSTADAKWVVARQLQGGPKYFLDADIKGCFDNINHDYLISKLNNSKMFKRQIEAWLKAGIMADSPEDSYDINEAGTPQGGVISPLLMNIALHGLENNLLEHFTKRNSIKVVRYADDFIVFSKSLDDVLKAKEIVSQFLKPIGLSLSEEKSRIGHSMERLPGTEGPPGLDFLGFNFLNIKCSIHRGVKSTQGKKQPFKLITRPSRDAVAEHKSNLRVTLKKLKSAPLGKVTERISSIIRGWTWYHSVTQCHKTFSKMDAWLWARLWKWASRRYKGRKNAKLKCFNIKGWNFGYIDRKTNKPVVLSRHDQMKVRKHVKVRPGASIYDSSLALYFAKRMSLSHPRSKNLKGIFFKQKYSCPVCENKFRPTDLIELHHVLNEKGKRTGELQWVHAHCHDQIHS
jgi:RNA-directed DNA polymerase